jgi:DNA gyrase subunit A
MDIARNDTELFVVTENGYGKRTLVSEYPVKGRGTKGVLTIRLTEKKGGLAGALIVNPHQDLLFISQNGMVQRTGVEGISQMGRSTQGVKVMNIKDDDRVSAVALAAESEDNSAPVEGDPNQSELPDAPVEIEASSDDGAAAEEE